MYENLYEPIPDTELYLKRLGTASRPVLDMSYLEALVFAHQCRIPFENLDVYEYHRPDFSGNYRSLQQSDSGRPGRLLF